jgi:hypothetical protein
MRPDGVVLENHAYAAPLGRDKDLLRSDDTSVDFDGPAIWPFKASYATQSGRLATAARSQERKKLPLRYLKRDLIQGLRIFTSEIELLGESGYSDHSLPTCQS